MSECGEINVYKDVHKELYEHNKFKIYSRYNFVIIKCIHINIYYITLFSIVMSVVIKNLQKNAVLNIWLVRKDLHLLRSIMGLYSFDVGLVFLSRRRMKQLNHKYRNKEESTDILSFPFHKTLLDKGSKNISSEEMNLGDIFLCPETIKMKYNIDDDKLRNVVIPLITHGLCHLCGYLHDTEKQWLMMNEKETEILQLFSEKTRRTFSPL
jgi:metalloprotein, YbeY/UPF0054 family